MFSFKSPLYFNLLFSTESCKVLNLRGLLSPSSSGWKLMKLGVPSLALSCLKTPKFMIYLSANRLRGCFAIVINYSHCKRTLCFQDKKASIPSALLYVDFLCTKKGKSLNRIDWKFWSYGYTHRLCELLVVCAALLSKSWPYPLRIRILLFLKYSFRFGTEITNTFIHSRNSIENDTRFQTKMGKM